MIIIAVVIITSYNYSYCIFFSVTVGIFYTFLIS